MSLQYDNEKICEQIDITLKMIIDKMSSFRALNQEKKFYQNNQRNENFCFLRKLERMNKTIVSGIFEYTAKTKRQIMDNDTSKKEV